MYFIIKLIKIFNTMDIIEYSYYKDSTPHKETKRTNNIIAIANNVELLPDIFKQKNINKPLQWMKKRNF